jgi:HD superfamily phosphohydrolase
LLLQLVDGVICFAQQDQQLVQRLYRGRNLMHKHVYQHPAVKGFELAVAHVLQLTKNSLDLEWLHEFEAVTARIVNPADPAASKRL